MAIPIKEWSKLEVRAVVRFLFSKGTKPSEIHKQIAETYGEGAMPRSRVYQWCTWFGEGRTSLGDDPKSGRPKTSTDEENTTQDDLISELRNWFDNLDVDFFRESINSLLSRWQKCIDLHWDYVEK
ncbi:cytochrome c oxidase assembly protein cox15-like protein [Plakobranchus ocellatus]|uniref:Cytochrome c oxidase assembly protein cox15-like protein n=1 Tax=Plakobranchus ocellatus TaxID=259542 RepID=A0AAV4AGA0_9GAST|nr:cytochrome c oxidase assembly protein cox15-like protein [Plakobranchus ocellatus]